MEHPLRERKMEIEPAATEATTNNTGDLVANDPLMAGPPAQENAPSFFALCKSLITNILTIYFVMTTIFDQDPVEPTYSASVNSTLITAKSMQCPLGGSGSLLHGEWEGDYGMEEDQDSMIEAMLDTQPVFGLIVFLYVLPVIFIILEVKNEIQFWWGRESLEGLSVRLVFYDVFQSLIVLLYLLDHDTSTLIKISTCIRIGIEFWKIHKAVDVKIDLQDRYMGFIPIRISVKRSYVDSNTNEYDAQAFKSLSWALLYPLFIAYAIYSPVYEEHQGWYSSALSMLHGYILKFACLMPIVQLFINYKLKSVAHLPWRMMTYRALHSFIDDIAASVTKRPSRSCLRGRLRDIIFLVFLYQRWIYRAGPLRLNKVSKQVLKARQKDSVSDPTIETAVNPLIPDEVILATAPKALEQKKNE